MGILGQGNRLVAKSRDGFADNTWATLLLILHSH